MVIIQRWEPVISNSFPSQIPFWVRIKGLPLHFWVDDMVRNIGKDLGEFQDHELTKTSARVKVLVDGLKPLTKEAIVEFDSGEESLIYLEYEKLENHCSLCYALSHLRKDCPTSKGVQQNGGLQSLQNEEEAKQKDDKNYEHVKMYRSGDHRDLEYRSREITPYSPREGRKVLEKSQPTAAFHERIDRHGNSFGARVETKQTRVPPPAKVLEKSRDEMLSWRNKRVEDESDRLDYNSPPYTKRREPLTGRGLNRRPPFL